MNNSQSSMNSRKDSLSSFLSDLSPIHIVSSHIRANQYSAKDLRECICISLDIALCADSYSLYSATQILATLTSSNSISAISIQWPFEFPLLAFQPGNCLAGAQFVIGLNLFFLFSGIMIWHDLFSNVCKRSCH